MKMQSGVLVQATLSPGLTIKLGSHKKFLQTKKQSLVLSTFTLLRLQSAHRKVNAVSFQGCREGGGEGIHAFLPRMLLLCDCTICVPSLWVCVLGFSLRHLGRKTNPKLQIALITMHRIRALRGS
jgi:hypothetical protein